MTVAMASRYAVLTHWIVVTEVWNARVRSASATATIVMSSIAATVPITMISPRRRMAGSRRAVAVPVVASVMAVTLHRAV
jgi:hypothetical protein